VASKRPEGGYRGNKIEGCYIEFPPFPHFGGGFPLAGKWFVRENEKRGVASFEFPVEFLFSPMYIVLL
jgi:hypothetical protein